MKKAHTPAEQAGSEKAGFSPSKAENATYTRAAHYLNEGGSRANFVVGLLPISHSAHTD